MEKKELNLNNDLIDLKKELIFFLNYYPWFILSLLLSVIAGFLFIVYSDDIYNSQAAIQIEKENNDPSALLTEGLGIDLYGSSTRTIENDIAIIKSNRILGAVIKDLGLQTSVYKERLLKNEYVWEDRVPFELTFSADFDPKTIQDIEINIMQNFALLSYRDVEKDINIEKKIIFGDTLLSKDFTILIPVNKNFEEANYIIEHKSLSETLELFKKNFNVGVAEDLGETVLMKLKGSNTIKNEAILNRVIQIVENDQIADKRLVFYNTINFINERLQILSNNIDKMQRESVDYRSKNKIFSSELQTGNALANIIKGEDEAFQLEMQLTLVNSLKESLENKDAFSLLPVNIGIENSNINGLVNQYNDIVIERDALLTNSTEKNPLVRQLSNQLKRFKSNILANITSYIEGINTSINRYNRLKYTTEIEVSSLPDKESELSNFARNFQITEGLYLFLLQRREEASLSYESAISDVKVVDYAFSSVEPIEPKPKLIFIGAFMFGLLVPILVLVIYKRFDNKIRTRDDLEGKSDIPIVAEIPFIDDFSDINDSRSILSEAIRMFRSNLSFILSPKNKSSVIAVTSGTKGEGKTFLSFNLACSLAANNAKVLIIGADLRNPQLHKHLNTSRLQEGLSDYLIDEQIESIDDMLLQHSYSNKPFQILLSGQLPPNPSELLLSPRFKELISREKTRFDYIILDCAPLLLVSDTLGLLEHTDVVLFSIFSGRTEFNVIEVLNNLEINNNSVKKGFVLNGLKKNSFSKYGYGYEYGYGYGYGYESD